MSGHTGYQGNMGTATGKQFYDKVPKGYKAGQLQQFTPEQMQLFSQAFGHVGPDSYLSRLAGGDEEIFNQIEGPAMKQFSALQGNIASRFSGMGTGARKSSGFQNTQNAAAQDFAGQLQSQRQGLQRQAILDLMGLTHSLLGERPYDRFLVEKPQKQGIDWGGLGGAALGGIGGFFAGGPAGVLTGAQFGYSAGSGLF